MIKVIMNSNVEVATFDTKEQAKKYVATCKRVDKKYGEKATYKIMEIK